MSTEDVQRVIDGVERVIVGRNAYNRGVLESRVTGVQFCLPFDDTELRAIVKAQAEAIREETRASWPSIPKLWSRM